MNESLQNLLTRRSCRKFKPDPVKDEELNAILEAGTYAPTGRGTQSPLILAITTPEETDVICTAIWHHDSKAEVDGPMDEILKDADVIDHSLSDPTKEIKPHEQARYAKLCEELDLMG